MDRNENLHAPQMYRIIVKGTFNKKWMDWFDNLDITHEKGNTVLTGPVIDQSALHGLLNRIRDFNLTLISVEVLEDN